MKSKVSAWAIALTIVSGCTNNKPATTETKENTMSYKTIHSAAQPGKAVVKHLDLDIKVDFGSKTINGTASYQIGAADDATEIIFDTRKLDIHAVMVDGKETPFTLGDEQPWLGRALHVPVTGENKEVSISYSTNPGADALQWLEPQQTAGKKYPFLFTQSQAILARTWIPCQDSPGIRYTYEATVRVPKDLLAVMSADNPQKKNESGEYHFTMDQPVPSYLMALAVGDLVFEPIGKRTGVYAEPEQIDEAVYEFADMEKMLESAEELYGPYAWEQYDVIVLPPSFPFGGMENPRITFATPTILAGDRSLTSLVAHELAHSWSGNLVTNQTWNDFWLNEGFTVYFERRIMEDIYGKDYANMLALLGYQDLQNTLSRLENKNPAGTKLKLDLAGHDPDEGMTDIAYEKGYLFLRTLEENIGRDTFDAFIRTYFDTFAFKSMNTEDFLAYMKENLFNGNQALYDSMMVDQWVYETGVPSNAVAINSDKFEQVESQVTAWEKGSPATEIDTAGWTTHQWLHFLRKLPDTLSQEQLTELDNAFGFTNTGNSEIAAEWFVVSIENNYTPAFGAMKDFLIKVGRRKFLQPIYGALVEADPTKERARIIYREARPNYHAVSVNTFDELLGVPN